MDIITIKKEIDPINFFDWGMECQDFNTNSLQVIGVSPITGISIAWKTVKPKFTLQYNSENSGQICGAGEYKLKMTNSHIQSLIQDAFKMQKLIQTIHFIRFINFNGQALEIERYIINNCIVSEYKFDYHVLTAMEEFSIVIIGNGDEQYRKVVRENGIVQGNIVTASYNVLRGVIK